MPEIIQCPSCQRELQVPEEFIGKPVKCPECGLNFVTSKQIRSTPLPRIGEVGSPAPLPDWSPRPAPSTGTPALVTIAALFLLLSGVLAMLADSMKVVLVLRPDLFPLENLPPQLGEAFQQQLHPFYAILAGGFGLTSLVVVIGAVQMMRMRTWGLAVAGAVLAALHLHELCCCLGAPAGIFALAMLLQTDVRARFQ